MIRSLLIRCALSNLSRLLLICLVLLILVLVLHLSQQVPDLISWPIEKAYSDGSEIQYPRSALSLLCGTSLSLLACLALISARTVSPLWAGKLSMITTSPGFSVGARTWST